MIQLLQSEVVNIEYSERIFLLRLLYKSTNYYY